MRILIRVCVAISNGAALTNIEFTLRSGILMSTPTTYWASLQGRVAGPQSLEEIYLKISPLLSLIPTEGVGEDPFTGNAK